MSALVSRDPFAREEIHRKTIRVSRGTGCVWCGSPRVSWGGKLSVYRYWIETDGGTKHEISGVFCSIGCMRAYHGR